MGSVFNDLVGQKGPEIRFSATILREILTTGQNNAIAAIKTLSQIDGAAHILCVTIFVSPLTIRIMPR